MMPSAAVPSSTGFGKWAILDQNRASARPGSPLAGDDSLWPAVSELARFGIATAVDHLGLSNDQNVWMSLGGAA